MIKRLWVFQWSNGKRGVMFALDAEEARRTAVNRSQFNGGLKADLATVRLANSEEEAEIATQLQREFLR